MPGQLRHGAIEFIDFFRIAVLGLEDPGAHIAVAANGRSPGNSKLVASPQR